MAEVDGGREETKWKTLSLTHVEYPEGDKVSNVNIYILYLLGLPSSASAQFFLLNESLTTAPCPLQ